MKIKVKDIIKVLVLFIGSGIYFFYKSANNTKGVIINSIFKLNVEQANMFYFALGCMSILVLVLCAIAVYLQIKRAE